MIALNALADVKLVTSIREGINLGAMEFIACQQQTRHGWVDRSCLSVGWVVVRGGCHSWDGRLGGSIYCVCLVN